MASINESNSSSCKTVCRICQHCWGTVQMPWQVYSEGKVLQVLWHHHPYQGQAQCGIGNHHHHQQFISFIIDNPFIIIRLDTSTASAKIATCVRIGLHRKGTSYPHTSSPLQPKSGQMQNGDSRPSKPCMMHTCFASYSRREMVRAACLNKFCSEKFHGRKISAGEWRNLTNCMEGKKAFFISRRLANKNPNTGGLCVL